MRQRTEPFALGRSRFEGPGERGERAAPRPARNIRGGKEPRHLVPERARLAWLALVGRGLANQRQPPGRAGARGVEEVALATHPVRTHEPRPERGPPRVVEEWRVASPPRQAALLEAQDEHRVERARARSREIDDRDTTRLAGADRPHGRAFECRNDLDGLQRDPGRLEARELLQHLDSRLICSEVESRLVPGRRRLEPEAGRCHRAGKCLRSRHGARLRA